MLDCICFCEAADSYTLKRLRNSSSTTVSPRLPMKRVLQGGLSFVFCGRKLECPIRRCSKKMYVLARQLALLMKDSYYTLNAAANV
jgi:hypothetical protein